MSALIIIPETAAERATRHMGQCQRLAELGMALAEAAAARAQIALAEPPPAPQQNGPAPIPPRAPHPATLFAQLAHAVRQAIRLEGRIVAGHAATLAVNNQADPRRAKIRRAIRQAAIGHFGRVDLCRKADERLEAELALDPDGTTSLPDLLEPICHDFGIELDYEKLAADLAPTEPASAISQSALHLTGHIARHAEEILLL